MPLHRDIFWIGRQWAVTGFGMQAINQRYNGQFDIPIARLWDDDLPGGARDQKWFNPDDFDKGLALARARYPQPPPKPAAPLPVEMLLQAKLAVAAPEPVAAAAEAPRAAPTVAVSEAVTPPEPVASFFEMRVLAHPARLLRVWRARRRQ